MEQEKTNPNTNIQGIDENGLATQGLELAQGRNFNAAESLAGSNICIIGDEIATTLFKKESPIDKVINAGNNRLRVIGVFAKKGSGMGPSTDRAVYVPLYKAKLINSNNNPSYTITVAVPNNDLMDNIIGEATSDFRNIRKVKITQPNNFEITKSDAVAQTLFENLKYVVIGCIVDRSNHLIGGFHCADEYYVGICNRTYKRNWDQKSHRRQPHNHKKAIFNRSSCNLFNRWSLWHHTGNWHRKLDLQINGRFIYYPLAIYSWGICFMCICRNCFWLLSC